LGSAQQLINTESKTKNGDKVRLVLIQREKEREKETEREGAKWGGEQSGPTEDV